MAFRTDGSVHHGGIATEQQVIDFLNSIQYYPDTIQHLGGTQNKADGVTPDKAISIKRKKNARQGSFDYVNTTQIPQVVRPYFNDLLEEVADLRGNFSLADRAKAVSRVRAHMRRSSAEALNSLTPSEVTDIVAHQLITRHQDIDEMAVTNGNLLNMYSPEAHPVARRLADGETFSLIGKAAGSRRVGDTDLRIRLVQNNGIGALLGLNPPGKNQNSSLVMKLQQDKVHRLLDQVSPTVFDMSV